MLSGNGTGDSIPAFARLTGRLPGHDFRSTILPAPSFTCIRDGSLMTNILSFLAILVFGGSLVGLLSGLFGVGGAFIIVPLMNILFSQMGVPESLVQHLAVGTAPSTMLITSLTTFLAHVRLGSMRWDVWRIMLPGIIVGALTGAVLAHRIDGRTLEILFGLIIMFMAVQMFTGVTPRAHTGLRRLYVPVSLFIGMLSSMTGVAGSMQLIVFLAWAGHDWCDCVSTAAALTLPISLTATISYIILGWNTPDLPAFSLGYVYLPGTLCLMIPGMAMAVVGAKLAHWSKLPQKPLKRAFSLFGFAISISILAKALGD